MKQVKTRITRGPVTFRPAPLQSVYNLTPYVFDS